VCTPVGLQAEIRFALLTVHTEGGKPWVDTGSLSTKVDNKSVARYGLEFVYHCSNTSLHYKCFCPHPEIVVFVLKEFRDLNSRHKAYQSTSPRIRAIEIET
jgi:hypothetical protein